MTRRACEEGHRPVSPCSTAHWLHSRLGTACSQLKGIREYHRKFPSQPSTETAEALLLSEVLDSAHEEGFTGEESEGRFVDMHALHDSFLNLKGVERVDYCAYLQKCSQLAEIVPKATALTSAYTRSGYDST